MVKKVAIDIEPHDGEKCDQCPWLKGHWCDLFIVRLKRTERFLRCKQCKESEIEDEHSS